MLRTIHEDSRQYCLGMRSLRGGLMLLLALLLQTTGLLFPHLAQAQTLGAPYNLEIFGADTLSVSPYTKYATANAAIQAGSNALIAQYGSSIPGQTELPGGTWIPVNCAFQVVMQNPPSDIFVSGNFQGLSVANLVYSYPSNSGATCDNASTGDDYIKVRVSNLAYDIGKNFGACSCTSGNGVPDTGLRPSDGSADGAVVSPNGLPSTPFVSDPINAATGNKYQQDTDFRGSPWLTFRRFYNSGADQSGFVLQSTLGPQWRHSFDRSLSIQPGSTIRLYRPDGSSEQFLLKNAAWTPDADVPDTLTEQDDANGNPTGYTVFMAAVRQLEQYSPAGLLLSITDESGQVTTLTYSTASTPSSVAPAPNLLITVTDPHGRQLNFTYGSSGNLANVVLPDGGTLAYAYDPTTGNLTSVQYPDGKSLQYVYNESSLNSGANLPGALTGVVDEAGVRYASTGYDSNGYAISTSFAGGVDATTVSYPYPGTGDGATVTTPLNFQYNFNTRNDGLGAMRVATVQYCSTQSCLLQYCGSTPCNVSGTQYDANGYPQLFTDFNNNQRSTTYSSAGLLTQEIDANGTSSQRTTNTTWNTALRVPLTRTVSNASGTLVSNTQWVYNALGQPLARCEIDPTNSAASGYSCSNTGTVPAGVRRWTYAYCSAVGTGCPLVGLMLTSTGPRTDLTQTTSYSYYTTSSASSCGTPGAACYQPGDLYQITDALGHVTTYASYDADGRVTRITDANGVNTDLTYYPRGWLKTRTVGGAQTSFTYMPYGEVQTITDPDGVETTFGYDTAHRLNKITDALGNYIQYTLDAAGNKTGEQIYDSSGALHKSLARTFNTLGQLTSIVDGLNHTIYSANYSDSYDTNGNLVHTADALGIQRHLGYDALNRLNQTIDDYHGTDYQTPNTTTGIGYDSLDRTTQITDPSNLTTTTSYNGLGDATGQLSPDTGGTTRQFDAAGNVTVSTDARGVVTQYTYDALDRITGKIYPAHPALNVTYTYDQATPIAGCTGGSNIGHLTTMTDASGTTSWCYTNQGDIREVRQVIHNTTYTYGYAYTSARRVAWLQYPSGFQLQYGYDGDGRVSKINYRQQPGPFGSYTNSTLTPLVTSVAYLPFGPVNGYSFQGGQSVTSTYDANYRLTDLVGSGLTLHFLRDAKGRIQAEGNSPGANPASETYQYDPLDRLAASLDASGATEESFTYNLSGDRLSKTVGQSTQSYTYTTGTHQLNGVGGLARSVDAAGNTTAMTDANGQLIGLGYDDTNRLTAVTSGGATIANYQYNGEGQRVWRTFTAPAAGQTATVYDPIGTGNLYGEYFATTSFREYVYLDGFIVASATDAGMAAPVINYLYADHLGTLRAVLDTSGNAIYGWPWINNAFGEQSQTGTIAFYNRFPGQYFDAETGLFYNGARYYDSSIGGFPQADPMGLRGGINPYVYGLNDPLTYIDPTGFAPTQPPMGPFSPEDPGRIPEASDIPSNIPGGPWSSAGAGQRPGAFWGPKPPQGGRTMCQYVPRESEGGPPGSTGYWKTQSPGQSGWSRFDLNGNPITPEQAHPGPAPAPSPSNEEPAPTQPSSPAETPPPVTEPPVVEPPVVEPPIIDPIIP